ncbi:tetratricopeptide repeat protein [bacterium]|nr:tetratricopeptide repeat protein [bacterium]
MEKLSFKTCVWLVLLLLVSCSPKTVKVKNEGSVKNQEVKEKFLDFKPSRNVLQDWIGVKLQEKNLVILSQNDLEGITRTYENLELAFKFLKEEQFLDAINLFENSLVALGESGIDDTIAKSYNSLGNCYYKLGRIKQAIEVYQIAIACKPDFFEAYNNIGHMNFLLKDYEKASNYFSKSIEIQPNYRLARLNLEVTKRILNNSLSINDLELLLDSKIPTKDLTEQIGFYKLVVSIDSTFYQAYNNLGVSYYLESQPDSAIFYLKKGLELNPRYAEACNNLGYIFSVKQKYEQAKEYLVKAISYKIGYKIAYNNLANVYLKTGDFENSESFYKAVLDYDPFDSDAIEGLRNLRVEKRKRGF